MKRTMLTVRGLVGLWFAARIVALARPAWGRTFELLADYLVIDGALALVVGILLLREGAVAGASRERNLGIVVLVDGLGRIASGAAVHLWPGIPGFPVTAVVFMGVMAVCTAAVGATEATLTLGEEVARHGARHSRPQIPAIPVALASIGAIVFGVGSVVSMGEPDRLHLLVSGYIACASVVMFGMAWSRR